MFAITAIIKTKKGHEDRMKKALLNVAQYVSLKEPETVSFYISQDISNPCMFTTYEGFPSEAAMERHSSSAAVEIFFGIAQPILDEEVVLFTSREISANLKQNKIKIFALY
ncbi:MAG: antibiotic biosynthesis monooxygenase [Rhodobacteraceae bacterium]|nr:antibiotic biosynthesis monooxygenase [Paracoccaceae bacterium]